MSEYGNYGARQEIAKALIDRESLILERSQLMNCFLRTSIERDELLKTWRGFSEKMPDDVREKKNRLREDMVQLVIKIRQIDDQVASISDICRLHGKSENYLWSMMNNLLKPPEQWRY